MHDKKIPVTKDSFEKYVRKSETWLSVIKAYIIYAIAKITGAEITSETTKSYREKILERVAAQTEGEKSL